MIQKISFGKFSNKTYKNNKLYMGQILKNDADRTAARDAFIRIGEISNEYGTDVFLDIVENRTKDDKKRAGRHPVDLMILDKDGLMITAQTFNTDYAYMDGRNKNNFKQLAENFTDAMKKIYDDTEDCTFEASLDLNA